MSDDLHIVPAGEEADHTRARDCRCYPIIEPGESPTVTHQSYTEQPSQAQEWVQGG